MQSLAEAITKLKIEHNLPEPEPDLQGLLRLRPTEAIRADLEALRRAKPGDEDPDDFFGGRHSAQSIERDIRHAERQLAKAIMRDTLQAARPGPCWCLGAGGRLVRCLEDGTEVFHDYCPCADGRARKEVDDDARHRLLQKRLSERAARLFAEARVPSRFQSCTLDSYPVSEQTRPVLEHLRLWVNGPSDDVAEPERVAWARSRRRSLLLHGPYGTGKTGLAVSILRQEVEIEGSGLFLTVPSLLDAIRATYGPKTEHDERDVIEAVKSAPFLVLDDLGAERVTDWVREKLFTVINHRHDEDLPTVFTSNLDVAELGEHIGERVTWRLVEMCEVIRVAGPNLRAR